MTRRILYLMLAFMLLVFVSTANAQSTTTGSAQTTTDNNAFKLKQQLQTIQEQKKATMSQVREEAKAMIAAKREEFKTKLLTIRNEKKKNLVERIDTKLSEVNKKHTDRFTEVLSKLQLLLDKISAKATETKVLADIKTAQAAIDTAETAVDAQAAKTYITQISDETKLKLDVGTTTSQLRQDLMATYKTVIDAKQAVQKLNTDKSIMKKEATSSANL